MQKQRIMDSSFFITSRTTYFREVCAKITDDNKMECTKKMITKGRENLTKWDKREKKRKNIIMLFNLVLLRFLTF